MPTLVLKLFLTILLTTCFVNGMQRGLKRPFTGSFSDAGSSGDLRQSLLTDQERTLSRQDDEGSTSYDMNLTAAASYSYDQGLAQRTNYPAGTAWQEVGGSCAPHHPEQGNQGLHADPPPVHVNQAVQRKIKVRRWDDRTDHIFTLDEKNNLHDLKVLIQKQFHIAIDRQTLMLNDKALRRKEVKEVYDIQSSLPGKPPVIIYEAIRVRVKTADKKDIHRPKICPHLDKTDDLKKNMYDKELTNLEPDMQLLVFDNKELQDNYLPLTHEMERYSIILLYTLVHAKIIFGDKEYDMKIAPRFHTVRNFKEKIYKEIIDIKPDSQSFSIGNIELDDKDLLSVYVLEEDFTKVAPKRSFSIKNMPKGGTLLKEEKRL